MSIIACFKWTIDEEDIRIRADGTLDFSIAKKKISDYDRNVIEAAAQLATKTEKQVIGLTFGNSEAKPSLKDALSRGLDEAYWLNCEEAQDADGAATARALARAINMIGDIDLVVCAEGSSDVYARQTAPRIGALLDWPVVTSAISMEFEEEKLLATRKLDDGLEKVAVELPAVISVLPEICTPPIPTLMAILGAGKKQVTEFNKDDLGIDLEPKVLVNETKGYVMDRKNIVLDEGSAEDRVAELVGLLQKEGVL